MSIQFPTIAVKPAYRPLHPLERPEFYIRTGGRQLCRECYVELPDMDLRLSGRDHGIAGRIPVEFLNANLRWRRA